MTGHSRIAWLATAAVAALGWSGSAQAQCSTITPPGGPTALACAQDTTTTGTVNSNPNNPSTSDREQTFSGAIVGLVNPGVTVTGSGLHVTSTGIQPVSFENNGSVINNVPVPDEFEILLERGLQLRSNGGDIAYTGNGSVTTTNPAVGLHLFTRDYGNIFVGSAAAPVTGDFTGRTAVSLNQGVTPDGTDPSVPLRNVDVFFHGGTFTVRPSEDVGVGIAISAQDSEVNLVMTGNSVISTANGVPGGGILINSLLVNSADPASVTVATDARIGSAGAPMHTGIVVFNYIDTTGLTDIALTGTGSIDATLYGIYVDGSQAGNRIAIATAAGSSIAMAPTATDLDSAAILADAYLGGDIAIDVAGSISGADYGIHARPENGRLDVIIEQGATVSGNVFGLRVNRFAGAGDTDILVLGTLSSPQTAAHFDGILRVGNGGTSGALGGNVVAEGTLIFDRSDSAAYAGMVSGPGILRQAGTGTLTLTGANSHTGGTIIERGILQLGSGGTGGSIAGDVANEGILAFNRSDAITFGGIVSGTGSVRQAGTGTVTLSGANTYTGGTIVQAGTLLVDGSIVGATALDAGARLGGTGRIGSGSFAGTLAPGNGGIGTLSTTANVSFAAGSTFEVEVAETGDSDRLAVGGTATLQGGTVSALFLGDASGRCGAPIESTILTAQGGVNGTFAAVTANFAFLTPSLSYDSNNVFLTLARNAATFSERGATPNQREAGAAAEALGCGNALFNPLVQLPASEARSAFEQISGEIHASARGALIDDSRFVREAMLARRQGRAAWASGYGSWGEIEGDGNAGAVDRNSAGLFAGLDLPLGPGWTAGIAGGRSRADFRAPARNSEAEIRSWHAAVRIVGQLAGFRLAGGGAIAWHRIDTSRAIAFAGFSDSPVARYDGRTTQAFAEASYAVPLGLASVEPFAGLAWVEVRTDGFAEAGGAAALTGESASDEILFTTIGLRGSAGFGPVSLTGSAGWRHASGLDPARAILAFGAGPAFTVTGAPLAEDALVAEAGAEIGIGGTARLSLVYSGQVAGRSEDHGARATLSIPF